MHDLLFRWNSQKMGAVVDEIGTYDTVSDSDGSEMILSDLTEGKIDIVTFTSSSTVKNFRDTIPDEQFDTVKQKIRIASIGPVTTETAENLGFNVAIHADEFTIPGLIRAIVEDQ